MGEKVELPRREHGQSSGEWLGNVGTALLLQLRDAGCSYRDAGRAMSIGAMTAFIAAQTLDAQGIRTCENVEPSRTEAETR